MFSIAVRIGLAVILLHFSCALDYYGDDSEYGESSIAARFDEGPLFGDQTLSDSDGTLTNIHRCTSTGSPTSSQQYNNR